MKKIIVIGGGFAGIWSSLGAMRQCKLLGKSDEVEILLINKDAYHGLRPRYYESELDKTRIPLEQILTPVGIKFVIGKVTKIEPGAHKVIIETAQNENQIYQYDRLIFAAGSQLYSPDIKGLQINGFNIDTYSNAEKLAKHLIELPKKPTKGRYTAVVVGGGFTGLEIATELPERLKNIAREAGHAISDARVIIIDRNEIGSTLGIKPQPIIKQALHDLNIETISHQQVTAINRDHLILESGMIIDTQTVIWTSGMRANPLTDFFPVDKDGQCRISVDPYLRVSGIEHCFACGDVAHSLVDETHVAMMSCQHAMPQGRIAGYNVVADLFGQPLIFYQQKIYRTCLDLGNFGALYTEGWDRQVHAFGADAKKTKIYINHERICPPLTGNIEDLLDAAAPEMQPMSI